ncbi:MAG: MarR family transcriptional regulator [Deltaproteobacteria bacterium]|nr:MarR family transcriptional regulator [Deltaproteobacteria bacterium]
MPPSQIARQIMVKSSTVTGVIDRLEHNGLVKRTRISSDRRVIISDTLAGVTIATKGIPLTVLKLLAL